MLSQFLIPTLWDVIPPGRFFILGNRQVVTIELTSSFDLCLIGHLDDVTAINATAGTITAAAITPGLGVVALVAWTGVNLFPEEEIQFPSLMICLNLYNVI